jgi:hypothetical protein
MQKLEDECDNLQKIDKCDMKCIFGTIGRTNAIGKPKEENFGPN